MAAPIQVRTLPPATTAPVALLTTVVGPSNVRLPPALVAPTGAPAAVPLAVAPTTPKAVAVALAKKPLPLVLILAAAVAVFFLFRRRS